MEPKLDRRRALFVLNKIDEILAWERTKEQERDVRFVELGRYLCEVRAGQYWRLENLKSFDEFLEKRFPESRRKAYYLMAIHEQLPRQMHREALRNLRGVIRTSYTTLNGRCFQNLESFAPASEWEELSCAALPAKPKQESADDL